MKNIKVTIDKKEVEVKQGTTILDAAKSVGITIPHYVIYTSKILILLTVLQVAVYALLK